MAFDLTPGEAADRKTYDTLIDLPEHAPKALLADKAHDTDAIRDDLKKRGFKAVTPPKSNRTTTIRYSKRLYRQRNCIERVIGHLRINRAIATRYDQLADDFLGMLYIATARYWTKFVHATQRATTRKNKKDGDLKCSRNLVFQSSFFILILVLFITLVPIDSHP